MDDDAAVPRPAGAVSICAVLAAWSVVVLLALMAVFQIALASGAPWGRFAWGGQHPGVLPTGLRVGSALAVPIYALIAVVALDRAGAVDLLPSGAARVGMWVVFAFFAVGVVMNGISRSKSERNTWTPVTAVLAALALVIALG